MTTIGSTSYANTSTYYSGAGKANGSNVEAETAKQKSSNTSETGGNASAFDSRPSNATQNFQMKLSGTQLDISALKVGRTWEASPEIYQRILDGLQNSLQADYSSDPEMPDLSDYAAIKPYAQVIVGGKVVATIDNQGVVTSDDDIAKKLKNLTSDVNARGGPDLAKATAEQIARRLGGRVEIADTAITQSQFDALPPPPQATVVIDYEGMRADARYHQLQDMMQGRAAHLDQQKQATDFIA